MPVPAHATAWPTSTATAPPRLPQNLTQAQRDAFGAHTYERIDRPGAVHSEWYAPVEVRAIASDGWIDPVEIRDRVRLNP